MSKKEYKVYKKSLQEGLQEIRPGSLRLLVKKHGNQHYQGLIKKLSSSIGRFTPPEEIETTSGLLLGFDNRQEVKNAILEYRQYIKALQQSQGVFKESFAEFI